MTHKGSLTLGRDSVEEICPNANSAKYKLSRAPDQTKAGRPISRWPVVGLLAFLNDLTIQHWLALTGDATPLPRYDHRVRPIKSANAERAFGSAKNIPDGASHAAIVSTPGAHARLVGYSCGYCNPMVTSTAQGEISSCIVYTYLCGLSNRLLASSLNQGKSTLYQVLALAPLFPTPRHPPNIQFPNSSSCLWISFANHRLSLPESVLYTITSLKGVSQ